MSIPENISLVEGKAWALAQIVHFGQDYGDWGPYFDNHVVKVWETAMVYAENRDMGTHHVGPVALLHDVLEDSDVVTADHLRAFGFLAPIVDDVVVLTRKPDEEYRAYIRRICREGSHAAVVVKLADARFNMGMNNAGSSLRKRYEHAVELLEVADWAFRSAKQRA